MRNVIVHMRFHKSGLLYDWINSIVIGIIDAAHEYSTSVKVKRRKQRMSLRGRPRRRGRILTSHAVMVLSAAAGSTRIAAFDTDSGEVGIDNRASGCFSHVIDDFVGPVRDCNRIVKGFRGSRTSNVKMGTLKWSWDDDEGVKTTHLIPNSYYLKIGGVRLLSTQHFAQESQKNNKSAGSRTTAGTITLTWGKGLTRTVPLDRRSNVATFHLSPGYEKFSAFCAQAKVDLEKNMDPVSTQWQREQLDHRDEASDKTPDRAWPTSSANAFNLEGRVKIPQSSDLEDKRESMKAELLQLHHNMGHIHPDRLKLMAKQGIIPPKYRHTEMPFCAACAYGKATRKPWRSRTSNNKDETERPAVPGSVVSVDQMISPTPGLIAQMTGMLTTQRYSCATVYVDQYSGYSAVLQVRVDLNNNKE